MQVKNYEFDVFVSHNRQQKQWVRKAVRQWRDLGLSVFFDEDNIDPGEDLVNGIERGLKSSKHVVLIISRASVASRWVAMEVASAIFADPDAESRRLIPLLLEPTPVETIRLSLTRLNMI